MADDQIVGVWQVRTSPTSPFDECIEIVALPNGVYQMADAANARSNKTEFKLIRAAGAIYMEPLAENCNGKVTPRESMPFVCPVRWERRGEWFAIDVPDINALKQIVNDGGGLRGQPTTTLFETLVITSNATELEAFLQAHADEVFTNRQVFHRLPPGDRGGDDGAIAK